MRIFLDGRSLHRHMGGIGQVALNLFVRFPNLEPTHQYVVLLGADPPDGIDLPDVELVQVEAGMIDSNFEQIGLPSLIEDTKTDLYFNPTFSVPALKTCTRQVSIIHDVVFEDHPEWVEQGLGDYLRRWSRFSAKNADHIVTVSQHARTRILDVYKLSPDCITRIHNGVPGACFNRPTKLQQDHVRQKFRLNQPYMLYIGSIEEKKGVRELVEAYLDLRKTIDDFDLVLAGAMGAGCAEWEPLLSMKGVKRIGYVEEVEKLALISACSLFVYPSKYEGFGLPPLEAMALGVPCVTSDATSIPEIVEDIALVVNVANKPAFTLALEKGLSDSTFRSRAFSSGPLHAQRFSWDKSAKTYLKLFNTLLEKR